MLVDGKLIPMYYQKAPYPAEDPYVVITGIHQNSDNDDDTFDGEALVDLNIYTCFPGDFGSYDLADAIGGELLSRVIPSPAVSGVDAEGFNVYGARLVSSRDMNSTLDSKSIYEKRITIEHLICQL